MLKNILQIINKSSKSASQITTKTDVILGVAPLGAPLVAQTAFGHQKWAPTAPKVLPMIEKSTKNDTKEAPRLKKNSKS